YPLTDFYETETVLTSMGIGEALVTALNEKGIPTPLAVTYMCPPKSRMDILTGSEIDSLIQNSKLIAKYNKEVDRESAYEILTTKLEKAAKAEEEVTVRKTTTTSSTGTRKEKSTLETVLSSSAARQVGRTAAN